MIQHYLSPTFHGIPTNKCLSLVIITTVKFVTLIPFKATVHYDEAFSNILRIFIFSTFLKALVRKNVYTCTYSYMYGKTMTTHFTFNI